MTEEEKPSGKTALTDLEPTTSTQTGPLIPAAVEGSSTVDAAPAVIVVAQDSFIESCIVIRAQLYKLETAIFKSCLAIADLIADAKIKYDAERGKGHEDGHSSDLTSECFVKAAALQLNRSPAFVQRFLTISKLDAKSRELIAVSAWRYIDNQTVLLALAREEKAEKRIAAIKALQTGDRSGFNAALGKASKSFPPADLPSEQPQPTDAGEAETPLKHLYSRGFLTDEAAAILEFQGERDPSSLRQISKHAAHLLDLIEAQAWTGSEQAKGAVSDAYLIVLVAGIVKPPTRVAKKSLASVMAEVTSKPQDEVTLKNTFATLFDAYAKPA